jgi:MFS family permease
MSSAEPLVALESHNRGPSRPGSSGVQPAVQLGLRANWQQFTILVLINAFVGAMVGLERTALPLVAANDFGIASITSMLAFIAAFGLTKALTNLLASWSVEQHGRRATLITGWLVGMPVPLMVLWAPRWEWIVAANALLGVSQGLAWSTTVIMKVDLVGPKRRGLAMGLNEFAGYIALAAAALASGFAAAQYGLRSGPAYLSLAVVLTGLILTLLLVRDTTAHARLEAASVPLLEQAHHPGLVSVLKRSLWSDRRFFSVSQAGFANNLNDGLTWGLFPIFFSAAGLSVQEIGVLVAIYPAFWGVSQLWTGALSDRWGRKKPIVAGMLVQGIALVVMTFTRGVAAWSAASVALGIGTALVYPAMLAAVGDLAQPAWRSAAIGVYRLWRDLGYLAGAILAGLLADTLGVAAAIAVVGIITVASGVIVAIRYDERGAAS